MSHKSASSPVDAGQDPLTRDERSIGIELITRSDSENFAENFKNVRKSSMQQQQQQNEQQGSPTNKENQATSSSILLSSDQHPMSMSARDPAPTEAISSQQQVGRIASGSYIKKPSLVTEKVATETRSPSTNGNSNNNKRDTKLRDTLAIGQLIASNKPTAGSRLIATEIKSLSKCIQESATGMRKELNELPGALTRAMKELMIADRERTGQGIFSSGVNRGRRTARSMLNPLNPYRRFPVFRRVAIRMRSRSNHALNQSTATTQTPPATVQEGLSSTSSNNSGSTTTRAENVPAQQVSPNSLSQAAQEAALILPSSSSPSSNNNQQQVSMVTNGRSVASSETSSISEEDENNEGSVNSGATNNDPPLTPISPPVSPS